jgi:hypothetical protein
VANLGYLDHEHAEVMPRRSLAVARSGEIDPSALGFVAKVTVTLPGEKPGEFEGDLEIVGVSAAPASAT